MALVGFVWTASATFAACGQNCFPREVRPSCPRTGGFSTRRSEFSNHDVSIEQVARLGRGVRALLPARNNHARGWAEMFFNWRMFRRALRLALFQQPFSLRRWAYVIFFSGLFLLFLGFVVVGRAVDHIFFPGFKRQTVKQPVFIIAPPRSGTTLVQNLFSLDEDRFVHLKMYQTIFPAVCFQRVFDALAAARWLVRSAG